MMLELILCKTILFSPVKKSLVSKDTAELGRYYIPTNSCRKSSPNLPRNTYRSFLSKLFHSFRYFRDVKKKNKLENKTRSGFNALIGAALDRKA